MPANEQISPGTISATLPLPEGMDRTCFVDSLLTLPGVQCKYPDRVKAAIHKILRDGASKLQVISDFDRTLTRYRVGSAVAKSAYGVLEDGSLMPPEYRVEAGALRDKFYPIEIDHNMPESEKIPYMIEWWTNANRLMVRYKLNYNHLVDVVRHSDLRLREHCSDFFDRLSELSIPILILSGGLTQIIEEVLKHQAIVHPNMHIVANTLKFDDEGNCSGLKGTLIHVFNKSEAAVHDSPYFSDLEHRCNAILLGDMVADLHMARGLPNQKSETTEILKIGFLNVKEDELMDTYLDAFDIVLTGDPGLELVHSIVKHIS